jgi:RecA/RadA recombinase
MATDIRKARAAKLVADSVKKYGADSAISGRVERNVPIYPTSSAAVNFKLGIGGLPGNAMSMVFGPPSIAKTTWLGFSVMRSVQAQGGMTALIATEPDVEDRWMERHGINLDYHVTFRPDTGEEAFAIMRDLVYDKSVDYIVYDSLAATSSSKEQNSEVPQAFGNAALNAWGIKNVATRCWKNNIGILFTNQIRDLKNPKNLPMVTFPGGHAVEHWMKIIIQLKPGVDKFKQVIDGEEEIVGRELIAVMSKNKAAEGLGKTARFNFFHIETDEYGLGIDRVKDVLTVASSINIVTGSGWLNHKLFPDGKLNGKAKAIEWLRENTPVVDELEKEIIEVMKKREAEAQAKARDKRTTSRAIKTTGAK